MTKSRPEEKSIKLCHLFRNHHCHKVDTEGAQEPEVNISPKNSISAQPLKMALYKNPAVPDSNISARI